MSKPHHKGNAFTRTLVPLVEQFYPGTEIRATEGRNDRGDLAMPGNSLFILEAKNQKGLALPAWWAETEAEAINAGTPFGVLVTKRRGTTRPEDQWAHMTLGKWLELVHRSSNS